MLLRIEVLRQTLLAFVPLDLFGMGKLVFIHVLFLFYEFAIYSATVKPPNQHDILAAAPIHRPLSLDFTSPE
jgi:hypothetical protein